MGRTLGTNYHVINVVLLWKFNDVCFAHLVEKEQRQSCD